MCSINHVCNGKDILLIISLKGNIFRDHRTYSKLIGCSRINPLTNFICLRSYFRQIINCKTIIDTCRSGYLCSIFLNKGSRIYNFFRCCYNSFKFFSYYCISFNFYIRILNYPFRNISGDFRDSWKRLTYCSSFFNLNNQLLLRLIRIRRRIKCYRNHFRFFISISAFCTLVFRLLF